jgi:uncharacterized membrane protein
MKHYINDIEKLLLLSIGFTLVLLTSRIIITQSFTYIFYAWNLFLAIMPFLCSRQMYKYKKLSFSVVVLLIVWLLFFPNAPYIVTDLFHFAKRPDMPYWFDLCLVMSAAWNGLLLGFISLVQVEKLLGRFIKPQMMPYLNVLLILLCSYGVYLGRYMRFNTWDVICSPVILVKSSAKDWLFPIEHLKAWAFTFLFFMLIYLMFQSIKKLSCLMQDS